MTFSPAQLQEIVNKINAGLDELSTKIGELPNVANSATDHWYVAESVAAAVKWLAQQTADLARWIWDKITEVVKGALAPDFFFAYAYDWEDIRGISSGVDGQLKPEIMPASVAWEGKAATAYHSIVRVHGGAAGKIAAISGNTSAVLYTVAAAGLIFYGAIALILARFVVAMAGAVAAFSTAAFSWAGLALAVEDAGVTVGEITAAVAGLSVFLGAQATQLAILHGEAVDNSAFPGGRWPDSLTNAYARG